MGLILKARGCTVLFMNFDLSVYFIADPSVCRDRPIEQVVFDAVQGGATLIQLRNKSGNLKEIENQALKIKKVLSDTNVPFIINDYVDIAVSIDADGVHIGQGDLSPEAARGKIGAGKILGLTAYTRDHYAAIDTKIVDYVGTGPVYPTKTKPDKPVLGLDGFAELIKYAPVPIVGIGGITGRNANSVIKAGANGVAMMRGISEADDVKAAAREFVKEVREATRRVVRKTNKAIK